MESLPLVLSCALDNGGLRAQHERYRRLGAGARIIERGPLSVAVKLDDRVDAKLVEETIAIERDCCPFYALDWDADRRSLKVSVSQPEHAPALGAITFALGLDAASPRVTMD